MNTNKKNYAIIITIICFMLLTAFVGIRTTIGRSDKDVVHKTESTYPKGVSADESETDFTKQEKKEPHLETYEDLVNAGSVRSEDIKDIDNNPYSFNSGKTDSTSDKQEESTAQEDKDQNQVNDDKSDNEDEKVNVIDESDETMKDETIEYEYQGEKSPSKKIEFFDVKQGGKQQKGDSAASGEHVGTWN